MARAGRAAWTWFVAGCGARADNCGLAGLAGLAQAAVEGRANRAALATTSKELVAIPRPANQAGRYPATAKGTQAAL